MFLGMCTFSEYEALKHHLYHVEDWCLSASESQRKAIVQVVQPSLLDTITQNSSERQKELKARLRQEADKTVSDVEAPKTAIIASLYFPNSVWLVASSFFYLTACLLYTS